MIISEKQLFIFLSEKTGKYHAVGVFDGAGVTVLANSRINTFVTLKNDSFTEQRKMINSAGVLQCDLFFKSPSAAAQFVSGRSANGWVEWRTAEGDKLEKYRYRNSESILPDVQTQEQNDPSEEFNDDHASKSSALEESTRTDNANPEAISNPPDCIRVFFSHRNGNYDAEGLFDGSGVTVLTGSRICKQVTHNRACVIKPRKYLDQDCILREDVYFKSPSSAAQFVSGRSADGWVEWHTADGEKLDKYRPAALKQSSSGSSSQKANNIPQDRRSGPVKENSAKEKIEFAPGQFITMERLNEEGITEEDLQFFCSELYAFAKTTPCFSVATIKAEEIYTLIDELGFDEMFYVSIIKLYGKLVHKKYKKVVFFGLDIDKINLAEMIRCLTQKDSSLEVERLVSGLQRYYGLVVTRQDVLSAVKSDTVLYYDEIMDYVYKDYETYFEDI